MTTHMRRPLVRRTKLNGQFTKVTFEASFLDYFPERLVRDQICRELDSPLEDVIYHAPDPDQQTFCLTTPYLMSLVDFGRAEVFCTRRVDPKSGDISFSVRLEWQAPVPEDNEFWASLPSFTEEEFYKRLEEQRAKGEDLGGGPETPAWLDYEPSPEWLALRDEWAAEFQKGFTTRGLTHPHLLPVLYAAYSPDHRVTAVDRSLVADGVGHSLTELANQPLSQKLLRNLAAFAERHETKGGGDLVYLCFSRRMPMWPRAMITILH